MSNENVMMPVNEMTILKAAIANLVDERFGSTRGWTMAREVPMIMDALSVSKAMAVTILEACDEVREHNALDLI